MSIVLVGNPRAGRGRARKLFNLFRAQLEAAGHRVKPLALGDPGFAALERFEPELFRGARALVACGGDGTINAVAGAAALTETPVYHVPTGNENLFARSFGMSRQPLRLVRALQKRHVAWTDTGRADGRRFLVMAGLGPDAGVIRRLHAARTRALGHIAYFEPIAREMARPTIQRMTVFVDGKRITDARRGWMIVANNREYAARINPASKANPGDGLLDIVFMPAANIRDCVNWVLRSRTRRHTRDARLLYKQGKRVVVEAEESIVHQIDGEAPETDPGPRLVFTVERRVLPVLMPG